MEETQAKAQATEDQVKQHSKDIARLDSNCEGLSRQLAALTTTVQTLQNSVEALNSSVQSMIQEKPQVSVTPGNSRETPQPFVNQVPCESEADHVFDKMPTPIFGDVVEVQHGFGGFNDENRENFDGEDDKSHSYNPEYMHDSSVNLEVDVKMDRLNHESCLMEFSEVFDGPTQGVKFPKGALCIGSPEPGRTMLARAKAEELIPFFPCNGRECEEMLVVFEACSIMDLFAAERTYSPCAMYINEIDANGESKDTQDQQYIKLSLKLQVELDGFKHNEGIFVIASTNFSGSLERAWVRHGQFDCHGVVLNPDVEGWRQILKLHISNMMIEDVDMITARGTPTLSGADLASLVNVDALKAAKGGAKAVTIADLECIPDKVRLVSEQKSADISEESWMLISFHENGHVANDVGLVVHDRDDNGKSMSTVTGPLIENEVKEISKMGYNKSKTIFITCEKDLHDLANAWLKHKMLSETQLKDLLKFILSSFRNIVEGTDIDNSGTLAFKQVYFCCFELDQLEREPKSSPSIYIMGK